MEEVAAPQAVIAADAPAPTVPQVSEPVASNPSPEAAVLQNAFDPSLLESALFPKDAMTSLAPVAPADPQPAPVELPPVTIEEPAGVTSPEPTPEPAPEVPAPEATETGTPEQTEPGTAPGEKILPNRISTAQFDQREQEAIALRHELAQSGQKITLREAIERVDAKYGAPTAATPEATPEAEPQPSRLEQVNTELADLRAQRDDQYAGQNLTSAELAELQTKIEDLAVEARLLAHEQAQTQRAQQSAAVQARDTVMQEVLKEYPTAGNDKTYLGARVAAKIAEIQGNPNHPERALLSGNDAPRKIVAHVESELLPEVTGSLGFTEAQALSFLRTGKATAAQPPAPTQTTGPQPVPRTLGVTAPGATAAPVQTPQPSAQDILNASLLDPSLAEKALGFGGGWTF